MGRGFGTSLVVAALAAAGGLAACGGGGGDFDGPGAAGDRPSTTARRATTTLDVSDNDVVCEQLRIVDRLDAEAQRVTDSAAAHLEAGVGDPAQLLTALQQSADLIEEHADEIDAAYAAAAAAARSDLAADIELLRTSTAALTPLMVEAIRAVQALEDIETLATRLSGPEFRDLAREAAGATFAVNRFTDAICGFTMTD